MSLYSNSGLIFCRSNKSGHNVPNAPPFSNVSLLFDINNFHLAGTSCLELQVVPNSSNVSSGDVLVFNMQFRLFIVLVLHYI